MKRFRSIISRLVALHVVAIGVISVLMPLALYWLLNEAANSLHRDALRSQAVTIGGFLRPHPTAASRSTSRPRWSRSIPAATGSMPMPCSTPRAVSCSPRATTARAVLARGASSGDWVDAPAQHRLGVVRRQRGAHRSATALYLIQVGQDLAHRDVIIDDIVASFFPRVAWITFPILLALLLIDIMIFRRALSPVREASTTAAAIGPTSTEVRLPEAAMPTEVVPLVHAVNQALDRLEAGFRAQRDFTADMAHELRTPLTIIRARVDSLEPGPLRDELRKDLENMTRIVNQVLDIAELESFIVAGDARADLQAVCAEAVAFMAPLAVGQSKTIALGGSEEPVWVHGHAEALFRAVRNLIENAIRHTPTGGSVEVEVSADGTVRVLDNGPGVPEAERELIFRRFWRRDRPSRKAGAWAWRSSRASRPRTTAASQSTDGQKAARSSPCNCGSPEPSKRVPSG